MSQRMWRGGRKSNHSMGTDEHPGTELVFQDYLCTAESDAQGLGIEFR